MVCVSDLFPFLLLFLRNWYCVIGYYFIIYVYRQKTKIVNQILAEVMIMSRVKDVGLPLMNVVRMKSASILQLLHLEERLLRTSSDNWFVVNDGTIHPTIVMGISGYISISYYSISILFLVLIEL